jgi:hypothetical protein
MTDQQKDPASRLSDFLGLALMALATIGSAWSGFQSSLWSGVQTFALSDALRAGRIASEKDLLSSQQRTLDGQAFMEYSRALAEGNASLAKFLHDRMRPEFLPALDAWLATKPLRNPNARASPFALPLYQLKAERESLEQERLAAEANSKARQANLASDSYTLLVFLYTPGLFLAGLAGSLIDRRFKCINIVLSLAFIVAATVLLFGLPVARRG